MPRARRRVCSRASHALLAAHRGARAALGHRHQQARALHDPVVAALGACAPRGRRRVGRHDAACETASGAAAVRGAALRLAPAACVYVGDDLRDVEAGQAAGMATIVAGYGYMGTGGDPAAWPATGWIEAPLDLLAWLPGRGPREPRRQLPGVQQQPFARRAVTRAGNAHRLLRGERLQHGADDIVRARRGQRRWPARADRLCSSRASSQSRCRRARPARRAPARPARPSSRACDDSLKKFGVQTQNGALESRSGTTHAGLRAVCAPRRSARERPAASTGSPRKAIRRSPPASRTVMPSGRTATSCAPCAISCPAATRRGPEGRRNKCVAATVALGEHAKQARVAGERASHVVLRCAANRRRRATAPRSGVQQVRRRSDQRRRRDPRGVAPARHAARGCGSEGAATPPQSRPRRAEATGAARARGVRRGAGGECAHCTPRGGSARQGVIAARWPTARASSGRRRVSVAPL